MPLLAPRGRRGLALRLLPGAEGLPPASISVSVLQRLLLEAPDPSSCTHFVLPPSLPFLS